MQAKGLLGNRRFMTALLLAAVIVLVPLVGEISVAQQPEALRYISDVAAVLCPLIAAVLLVRAWGGMSETETSKRVWGLIALGLVLWTIAEALWGFYELALNIEVPYPSIADIFWLAGYVPIYMALVIRYRALQAKASLRRRLSILLFIIVYSGLLVYYVAVPIFTAFDPTKVLESLTNIAYPLVDWGVCILTLLIIFSLENGRFAAVWQLFGAGLLLTAIADSLFFYASWNEIYYPDGMLNSISALLDALFNESYLAMGLAIYAYTLMAEKISTGNINLALKSLAKMNVLVFVDPEGKVLSLSDNFMNLVRAPAAQPYIGLNLAGALGLDSQEAGRLMEKIKQPGSLSNYPVLVKDASGGLKNAWITSLRVQSQEAHIDSVALVLRADPPAEGERELPLHEDQKMLIDYYLGKSGTSRIEENQALRGYFIEQINLLYSLVEQFSGTRAADNLLDMLCQLAAKNHWPFYCVGRSMVIPEEFEGGSLAEFLQALLRGAAGYAADMTDRRMVEQEMKGLDKSLAAETLGFIDKYRLREATAPAG